MLSLMFKPENHLFGFFIGYMMYHFLSLTVLMSTALARLRPLCSSSIVARSNATNPTSLFGACCFHKKPLGKHISRNKLTLITHHSATITYTESTTQTITIP